MWYERALASGRPESKPASVIYYSNFTSLGLHFLFHNLYGGLGTKRENIYTVLGTMPGNDEHKWHLKA